MKCIFSLCSKYRVTLFSRYINLLVSCNLIYIKHELIHIKWRAISLFRTVYLLYPSALFDKGLNSKCQILDRTDRQTEAWHRYLAWYCARRGWNFYSSLVFQYVEPYALWQLAAWECWCQLVLKYLSESELCLQFPYSPQFRLYVE